MTIDDWDGSGGDRRRVAHTTAVGPRPVGAATRTADEQTLVHQRVGNDTMMSIRTKALLMRWVLSFAKQTPRPPSIFYRPFSDCQVRGLDAIYSAAFGELRDGVFVEVGAYDGQFASNTCFLADLGWRGVYVEAIPEFAAACSTRHQHNINVTVVNAAVGKEIGSTELYLAGALSTRNDDFYSAYQNIFWAKSELSRLKVTTPILTLNKLLCDCNIPNGFELLVVDVEGSEPDVFEGFDIVRWKPKMMIVELEDPDFVEIDRIREPIHALRRRILESGYTEMYVDAINTIFIANFTSYPG
jgi:FkbM family methyltransferase